MTPEQEAVGSLVLIAIASSAAPLHAYVDPGSGSLLVQMLLGGVAGLIVAARYYWKRFVGNFSSRSRDAALSNDAPPADRRSV